MTRTELRLKDHDFVDEIGLTIVDDSIAFTVSAKVFTGNVKQFADFVYPKYYDTMPVLAGVFAGMLTDTLSDLDQLMDRVPLEQREPLRCALIRALAQVERVTDSN